jgi:hypothetical protein
MCASNITSAAPLRSLLPASVALFANASVCGDDGADEGALASSATCIDNADAADGLLASAPHGAWLDSVADGDALVRAARNASGADARALVLSASFELGASLCAGASTLARALGASATRLVRERVCVDAFVTSADDACAREQLSGADSSTLAASCGASVAWLNVSLGGVGEAFCARPPWLDESRVADALEELLRAANVRLLAGRTRCQRLTRARRLRRTARPRASRHSPPREAAQRGTPSVARARALTPSDAQRAARPSMYCMQRLSCTAPWRSPRRRERLPVRSYRCSERATRTTTARPLAARDAVACW